jgi:ABC-type transport system substrate-binding protein
VTNPTTSHGVRLPSMGAHENGPGEPGPYGVGNFTQSQRSGLNRRPLDYESSALPLSYAGDRPVRFMPWRGLEPRRLAAPPPQDGVSTNFTTRANHYTNIETNIVRG